MSDPVIECQRCGKPGGKVVSFSDGKISFTVWVCPSCMDADRLVRAQIESMRERYAAGQGEYGGTGIAAELALILAGIKRKP